MTEHEQRKLVRHRLVILRHGEEVTGNVSATGWTLPVREVQLVTGAGFVLPLAGSINSMPGLGLHAGAHSIDIDEEGNVVGLS